jgi:hypothetical protein
MGNRGNQHGGYAGKNSNPGAYRGGKTGNSGRPRGNKNGNQKGCCSYQEAGRALLRGKGGLALRYVRLDVKARLGII